MPNSHKTYRKGHDKRILRDVFGCFATGVTIITTTDEKDGEEGKPHGITANSFTSVSLEPPMILVCIAKSSGSCEIFKNAKNFAVNILSASQKELSEIFAKRNINKFSHIDKNAWHFGENNCPIINDTVASLECCTHEILDGGDHIILMGIVESAFIEPTNEPLLYYKGKYQKHHP
jgi:flavin reductase (DIM6/NTAB) family NADH-FMN oxidoreductase RutF